jgi:hypothetical protein
MGAKRSHHDKTKPGVYHIVALPITLKKVSFSKRRNYYGNSNISPCKNIANLQKNPLKRNQNPSRYYYNSL